MSSWESVLEQLASLDAAELDPATLSTSSCGSSCRWPRSGINRLTAMQTRAVGAGETAGGARRRRHGVDEDLADRALPDLRPRGGRAACAPAGGCALLPALAAAYAAGAVTPAHVGVVTAAVTPARVAKAAEQGIDLATTDQILTDAALALGPEDTAQAVRRWVAGIDPDGLLDDAAGLPRIFRMAARRAAASTSPGTSTRSAPRRAHRARGGHERSTAPPATCRTHAERQGDALVELARRALAAATLPDVRGQRAHVRVTIDWMALCAERGMPGGRRRAGLRRDRSPPRPPAGWPATPASARILTDPAGLPLDVGPGAATAPAAIRRGVEARDGHCVFTGCTAPAAWCDVHHVDALGLGRPDLLRQRRAASANGTTPPSTKAASASPATPAPPLAHLPPRRHRDPHPRPRPVAGDGRHPSASRLTTSVVNRSAAPDIKGCDHFTFCGRDHHQP